jgi:hypothetical protein
MQELFCIFCDKCQRAAIVSNSNSSNGQALPFDRLREALGCPESLQDILNTVTFFACFAVHFFDYQNRNL